MKAAEIRYLMIPESSLQTLLAVSGAVGIIFGIVAFAWPSAPLRFYQWTMSLIHWRVEPECEKTELRNTRIMGALMIPLSILIFVLLRRW